MKHLTPLTTILDAQGRPLQVGDPVALGRGVAGVVLARLRPGAPGNPYRVRRFAAVIVRLQDGSIRMAPSRQVHRIPLPKGAIL